MARKNVAFECKVMAAGGLCNAVQDIDIFIAECIFSYDKNIVLLSRFFSPPNSCYKDFSFFFVPGNVEERVLGHGGEFFDD